MIFLETCIQSIIWLLIFRVLVSIFVPLSSFLANLRLRGALCVILDGFPDELLVPRDPFWVTFWAKDAPKLQKVS